MNALRKTSGNRDNNLVVKLQKNSKEQLASQSPGIIINVANMIGRHVSVGKENKSLSRLISHKLNLFFMTCEHDGFYLQVKIMRFDSVHAYINSGRFTP